MSCDPEPGGQPRPPLRGQRRGSLQPHWGASVHFPVIIVLPRSQGGMEVRGTVLKPQGRETYCSSKGQQAASPRVDLDHPLCPRSAHHLPTASLKFSPAGLPGGSPLWPQNMLLPIPGTMTDLELFWDPLKGLFFTSPSRPGPPLRTGRSHSFLHIPEAPGPALLGS